MKAQIDVEVIESFAGKAEKGGKLYSNVLVPKADGSGRQVALVQTLKVLPIGKVRLTVDFRAPSYMQEVPA